VGVRPLWDNFFPIVRLWQIFFERSKLKKRTSPQGESSTGRVSQERGDLTDWGALRGKREIIFEKAKSKQLLKIPT
jgi:hypothetical protein